VTAFAGIGLVWPCGGADCGSVRRAAVIARGRHSLRGTDLTASRVSLSGCWRVLERAVPMAHMMPAVEIDYNVSSSLGTRQRSCPRWLKS
jgi:hypothetical protein